MTESPLASGRDADVYAFGSDRVLRRYRAGGDVAEEAAVMRHVAAYGYPVPEVYEANGADLVMERLDGPTMLASLAAGALGTELAGAMLADLHRRLHALPLRVGDDPQARILHLDLHPGNVVFAARGPVVIDWRDTAEGPPELDIALSALILAEVAVNPGHDLSEPAADLLRAFLRGAEHDPAAHLDQAVDRRRNNPTLSATEIDRLDAAATLVTGSRPPAG